MGIFPTHSKKSSHSSRRGHKANGFLSRIKAQRGAVSPFLFGLLAGVAIFSGTMKAKSELKLKQIKEAQVERERETAEQYKRAIEGAILSETAATYGTLDRARIEENLAKGIGGGTRSGEKVAIGTIDTNASQNEQRVIISTSDDKFVRDEVTGFSDATTAAESNINKRGDIANVDTAALRTRQVEQTRDNLNRESALIYAFWGANGQMPNNSEYNTINNQTGLTDFWGADFDYTRDSDDKATLKATTPWSQDVVVQIDMN